MDTEARWATVQRAAGSQTRLKRLNTHAYTLSCWRILIAGVFLLLLYFAFTPIIFDILVINKPVVISQWPDYVGTCSPLFCCITVSDTADHSFFLETRCFLCFPDSNIQLAGRLDLNVSEALRTMLQAINFLQICSCLCSFSLFLSC